MASSLTAEQEISSGPEVVRPRPVAPRRRRVRERVSLGHLFMIASALLAFVLVVSLLQDRRELVQVLVAEVDIAPGEPVTMNQVRQVDLPADNALASSLATVDALAAGASAAQRITAGDPITSTALAPQARPGGLRAMSLPIDRSRAVGGDVRAGDRIDVVSVEAAASARYVAVDLEVLGTQAASGSGGFGGATLSDYFITVAVDDQTALELALALEIGEISVLRSTGASPVPPDGRRISTPVEVPLGSSSAVGRPVAAPGDPSATAPEVGPDADRASPDADG